ASRARHHRPGGRAGALRARPVLSPGAAGPVVGCFETYGAPRGHHHRRLCLAGRLGSPWPGSPPSQSARRKRCCYRRSEKAFSPRSSGPIRQARYQCKTVIRERSRDGFAEAAARIVELHGEFRVPTLLKRVDRLCRGYQETLKSEFVKRSPKPTRSEAADSESI